MKQHVQNILAAITLVLLAAVICYQQAQIRQLRIDNRANSEAASELERKYGEVPNEPSPQSDYEDAASPATPAQS